MVSYRNQLLEMKHNFQFLLKSLDHDGNVSNEYIKPSNNQIDVHSCNEENVAKGKDLLRIIEELDNISHHF